MAAVDDELLNRVTWKIPNALALVGSRAGDEWNGMTTSWITQVSMEPVLIGVGVDNSAVTHRLIAASGSFTVNLWSAEDTKVFVKFSKPATYDAGGVDAERPRRAHRHDGCAGLRRGGGLDGLRGAVVARLRHATRSSSARSSTPASPTPRRGPRRCPTRA